MIIMLLVLQFGVVCQFFSLELCFLLQFSLSTCNSICRQGQICHAGQKMYSKEHRCQHIERQLIDSWPHVEDPISLLFSLTPFTGILADGTCTHLLHTYQGLVQIVSFFTLSPSHQIFGHMHGVLNVGKKITNYTVCFNFVRRIF